MEKSIFWLKAIRKGATIVASILLFVGILLDLVFRYINISSLIGYDITGGGIIVFALIFGLSIAISFLVDKQKAKQNKETKEVNETNQENLEEGKKANESPAKKDNFITKVFGFMSKQEATIKLFVYILAFCLTMYLGITTVINKFYWHINYYLCLFFWVTFLISFIEMFYSKDKKTFITSAVLLICFLAIQITFTVFAHNVFFNATAKANLKLMDILMLIVIIFTAVLNLIITSDNQILKVKHTRNFGLGLVLLCSGILMYFVKPIAAFMLKKWDTTADLGTKVEYLNFAHNVCTYIVIGIILVAMLNVALNTTHYIKTKNWLGLLDIGASFICVILCILGLLAFSNFIAFLK